MNENQKPALNCTLHNQTMNMDVMVSAVAPRKLSSVNLVTDSTVLQNQIKDLLGAYMAVVTCSYQCLTSTRLTQAIAAKGCFATPDHPAAQCVIVLS